jgi:allantoicase
MVLLSQDRHVLSSVRGNLGPPSVVVSEIMDDWLTDRWQAARNMGGDPIPGRHWLIVDLLNASVIERVLIDWEVALSNDYAVEGCNVALNAFSDNINACSRCNVARTQQWQPIASRKQFVERGRTQHHIIHESLPLTTTVGPAPAYRCVKLAIHTPATRFGSSVWRLQLWGHRQEPGHDEGSLRGPR